jgi:hypothetical protein
VRGAVRIAAAVCAVTLSACGGGDGGAETPVPEVGRSAELEGGVWVVGDGAVPGEADDRLAKMIEGHGVDQFLYLGDVYDHGTAEEFRSNYDTAFGRFKDRTYPVPGNHDWPNHAEGYDVYFAELMRRNRGRHYYAFDIGRWHFVALNTEEPVGPGSPQFKWLRRHLAKRPDNCTMVISHAPRLNAGEHGEDAEMTAVWKQLLRGKAVAVLSGHDHDYQRFEPEDGITQIIVGTGGRGLYDVREDDSRLAASDDKTFGALRMELAKGRASYDFVTIDARSLDSGTLSCDPAR